MIINKDASDTRSAFNKVAHFPRTSVSRSHLQTAIDKARRLATCNSPEEKPCADHYFFGSSPNLALRYIYPCLGRFETSSGASCERLRERQKISTGDSRVPPRSFTLFPTWNMRHKRRQSRRIQDQEVEGPREDKGPRRRWLKKDLLESSDPRERSWVSKVNDGAASLKRY